MKSESLDFPAAHSMDTDWFAVDEEGCVALFDSMDAGSVPHRFLYMFGPKTDVIPGCLQDLHPYADILEPKDVVMWEPAEAAAPGVERNWPGGDVRLVFEDPQSVLKAQEVVFRHGTSDPWERWLIFRGYAKLWPIPVRDKLVYFVDRLSDEAMREILDRKLARICWSSPRERRMRPSGLIDFLEAQKARSIVYEGDNTNAYTRSNLPEHPILIGDLPECLRTEANLMPIRGIHFRDTSNIQPLEHWSCAVYCHQWLSADGKKYFWIRGSERSARKDIEEIQSDRIRDGSLTDWDRSIENRHPPLFLQPVSWLASDSIGQVALFYSSNNGAIPLTADPSLSDKVILKQVSDCVFDIGRGYSSIIDSVLGLKPMQSDQAYRDRIIVFDLPKFDYDDWEEKNPGSNSDDFGTMLRSGFDSYCEWLAANIEPKIDYYRIMCGENPAIIFPSSLIELSQTPFLEFGGRLAGFEHKSSLALIKDTFLCLGFRVYKPSIGHPGFSPYQQQFLPDWPWSKRQLTVQLLPESLRAQALANRFEQLQFDHCESIQPIEHLTCDELHDVYIDATGRFLRPTPHAEAKFDMEIWKARFGHRYAIQPKTFT